MCARWDEAEYKKHRCGPEEFQRRWGQYGITQIWRCARGHVQRVRCTCARCGRHANNCVAVYLPCLESRNLVQHTASLCWYIMLHVVSVNASWLMC